MRDVEEIRKHNWRVLEKHNMLINMANIFDLIKLIKYTLYLAHENWQDTLNLQV